jgi:hypothetical protein
MAASADLRTTLTSALQGYCIPKDGEGCGLWRACYKGGGCDCGTSPYLVYSAAARRCVGKCQPGQEPGTQTISCAAGQQRNVVKSSEDC